MTVVKSNYAPKANNLYETDYWATRAFLRLFPIVGKSVWEPAAGNHKMADILLIDGGAGSVFTSDIETYTRPHSLAPLDFLTPAAEPFRGAFDAIVTNPPFGHGNRLAAAFARRALDLCPGLVAMLLTAKFDHGSTRGDLFRDNPRFIGKIALMDRILWFDGPDSQDGTEDHAWFVWGPSGRFHVPTIFYAENPDKKRRGKR